MWQMRKKINKKEPFGIRNEIKSSGFTTWMTTRTRRREEGPNRPPPTAPTPAGKTKICRNCGPDCNWDNCKIYVASRYSN
ncbi:hypothetical protein GWI33_021469 [Rhynchophorus ferrugineus]|uniref:Uncharacterized protein n=1 Tax=Rhynchophorus ferrugineus TaxID=354439 RepID=A0A834M2F1_RHYFE|nr:hypothetical protein GWI33_021469 [Rhynchophorus ferrugineus]